ncbi:hypothetical protein C8Q74DRAFT_144260 [Fomes fomentarius]|nr:hypothetical protein C8Q74DRAFT_144260 [Fomes fomentarius]
MLTRIGHHTYSPLGKGLRARGLRRTLLCNPPYEILRWLLAIRCVGSARTTTAENKLRIRMSPAAAGGPWYGTGYVSWKRCERREGERMVPNRQRRTGTGLLRSPEDQTREGAAGTARTWNAKTKVDANANGGRDRVMPPIGSRRRVRTLPRRARETSALGGEAGEPSLHETPSSSQRCSWHVKMHRVRSSGRVARKDGL